MVYCSECHGDFFFRLHECQSCGRPVCSDCAEWCSKCEKPFCPSCAEDTGKKHGYLDDFICDECGDEVDEEEDEVDDEEEE